MRLRKKLARAIATGQPWIFRDAVAVDADVEGALSDGDVVLIADADGRVLGRGFWTRSSPIAVRVLTTERQDELPALVRARLETALAQRLAFIDRRRTTAFRWVNGEADRLPGVHLDVYGTVASVRFDGAGARAFYRDIGPAILDTGSRLGLALTAVIARRHVPRVASGVRGTRAKPEPAASSEEAAVALIGALPPDSFEVREDGLKFEVDLLHGQKGGLFLDQRENRARVAAMARGRRVLNLFGYTGGFSVHAAAAGGAATTTVDLAPGAIAAARRNFERNGLLSEPHEFVVADVFAFLEAAAAKGQRWDVVISDPPSFAPRHSALAPALHAYTRLHRLCASVVEPGGILCAASCSSHVEERAFRDTVQEGCRLAGRRFVWRESHGAAPDHPVADFFPEGRYLKFVVGTVP